MSSYTNVWVNVCVTIELEEAKNRALELGQSDATEGEMTSVFGSTKTPSIWSAVTEQFLENHLSTVTYLIAF